MNDNLWLALANPFFSVVLLSLGCYNTLVADATPHIYIYIFSFDIFNLKLKLISSYLVYIYIGTNVYPASRGIVQLWRIRCLSSLRLKLARRLTKPKGLHMPLRSMCRRHSFVRSILLFFQSPRLYFHLPKQSKCYRSKASLRAFSPYV